MTDAQFLWKKNSNMWPTVLHSPQDGVMRLGELCEPSQIISELLKASDEMMKLHK